MTQKPVQGTVYVLPQLVRVVREGAGQPAKLYIDGVFQPWATVTGFSTEVRRAEMPGITLTLAANRIEIVNDLDFPAPDPMRPGRTNP